MLDEVRDIRYIKLLLLTLALAVPVSILALLFLAFVENGTAFLWQTVPATLLPGVDPRLYTVGLALLGGLLVGLVTRFLVSRHGTTPLQKELFEEGRVEYRGMPAYILGAILSLLSGASLGPEVAIAHLSGGIGTWFAERRQYEIKEKRVISLSQISAVFAALFGSPLSGAFMSVEFTGLLTLPLYYNLIAAVLAGVIGIGVAAQFGSRGISGIYDFGVYQGVVPIDIFYAFVLGLFGVAVAFVYKAVSATTQRIFTRLEKWPVLRPVVGATIFGVIGAMVPLTLFSGEHEILTLHDVGMTMSAWMLVALFLLKLITLSVSLSSGFTGGFIFPLIFASGALGMAVHQVLPFIPSTVAVVATVAGMAGAVMRMPFAVTILLTVLVGPAVGPIVSVAALTSFLVVLLAPQAGNAREDLARAEAENEHIKAGVRARPAQSA